MCIFSGHVDDVSSTAIFAHPAGEDRQLLV